MSNPRVILAAGVAVGSALAYGIFRRYKATFAPEEEPGERFYSVNGVRVTAGEEPELDYIEVDGIKLTRVGPDRL